MATHPEIHHCSVKLTAILEQGILNFLLPYDWLLDFNSGVRSNCREEWDFSISACYAIWGQLLIQYNTIINRYQYKTAEDITPPHGR